MDLARVSVLVALKHPCFESLLAGSACVHASAYTVQRDASIWKLSMRRKARPRQCNAHTRLALCAQYATTARVSIDEWSDVLGVFRPGSIISRSQELFALTMCPHARNHARVLFSDALGIFARRTLASLHYALAATLMDATAPSHPVHV